MAVRNILYLAPVVYNGLGTPRKDGALLVQEALEERRVVAVGSADELRRSYPEAEVVEETFALSPPVVNAHTHLDLTDMPHTPAPYEQFIAEVIQFDRSGGRGLAAARRGVDQLLASGTTVVGDIVAGEEVMRFLLAHDRLQGVAYWEVLGPDPADAERILAQTEARIREFKELESSSGMRLGLAPHSPHTVSAPLLRGLAFMARKWRLPMQIHVAESESEVVLHREGSGRLAEALRGFLPDWRPSGLSPVAFLERLRVLEAEPTLVHMVHVSDEDIDIVRRHNCVVVHCPRSNSALQCGRFPWERYAMKGVTVGLGTDSRASSPSLSVEDEVDHALGLHGEKAPAQALVRAAVKGGHRALGMRPPRFVRGDQTAGVHAWQGATVAGA